MNHLYALYATAALNAALAGWHGHSVGYALAAGAVVIVVLEILRALPGPTPGWRSPSGAISTAPRGMPRWAVIVGSLALFGGLGCEVWILSVVWGVPS